MRWEASQARIDEITKGIYRASLWVEAWGITLNQFVIVDEKPTLIETGLTHTFAVYGSSPQPYFTDILDKIEKLQPTAIAPMHGALIVGRGDVYIQAYREWVRKHEREGRGKQ